MFKKALHSLAILVLLLPSLASAAVAPAEEPADGLIPGPNPEWGVPHMEYHDREAAHATYHQQMQQKLDAWRTEHLDDRGTENYEQMYRDFRAQLNFAHRMAHANEAKMRDLQAVPPGGHGGVEPVIRTYNRPSPRLIREAALERVARDLMDASKRTGN